MPGIDPSIITAFIIERGLYCYKMMSFSLKNAGETYQSLVNWVLESQIGRNMEVYMDNMFVKGYKRESHLTDLEQTFITLKNI